MKVKIFIIFIVVWFVASLLNGVLSGTCVALLEDHSFGVATKNIGLSLIFSFILSVPFVGFVWLVTLIAQVKGRKGYLLFQTILSATIICSILAAIFFISTIGTEFKTARFVVGFSIILSAMCGVLFFRNQLKADE